MAYTVHRRRRSSRGANKRRIVRRRTQFRGKRGNTVRRIFGGGERDRDADLNFHRDNFIIAAEYIIAENDKLIQIIQSLRSADFVNRLLKTNIKTYRELSEIIKVIDNLITNLLMNMHMYNDILDTKNTSTDYDSTYNKLQDDCVISIKSSINSIEHNLYEYTDRTVPWVIGDLITLGNNISQYIDQLISIRDNEVKNVHYKLNDKCIKDYETAVIRIKLLLLNRSSTATDETPKIIYIQTEKETQEELQKAQKAQKHIDKYNEAHNKQNSDRLQQLINKIPNSNYGILTKTNPDAYKSNFYATQIIPNFPNSRY